MLKRRMVAAATLSILQGCAGFVVVKLPSAAVARVASEMAAPEANAKPTTAAQKPAATNNATATGLAGTLPPPDTKALLAFPTDVSVKLTAGLLGEGGSSVISNDGGSVISNDGGSVISNDGGSIVAHNGSSYQLASLQDGVGPFFGAMAKLYGITVLSTNTLLSGIHDMDEGQQADFVAGKRVKLGFILSEVGVELKQQPGADAQLRVFYPADGQQQVMSLSFKDIDHGTVVYHFPKNFLPVDKGSFNGTFNFASTFDRHANRAEVDLYFDDTNGEDGKVRLHLSIMRPKTITAHGPTLQVRASRFTHGSSTKDVPDGVVEATGYGLADGSAAAIGGFRPLGASGLAALLTNPDAATTHAPPHAFFLGNDGKALHKPTPDLLAAVPDDGDVLLPFTDATGAQAYYPDPFTQDYDADPAFTFPK